MYITTEDSRKIHEGDDLQSHLHTYLQLSFSEAVPFLAELAYPKPHPFRFVSSCKISSVFIPFPAALPRCCAFFHLFCLLSSLFMASSTSLSLLLTYYALYLVPFA